ncbi:YwmB family TATA-box binding protein [Konateibacter massiliensis]|uniref:YwmB family TATA-box binding protein n=1 Tax=Konateibacter massiliensis TaxID=2002841 RepID=UPI0015D4A7A1|nr:YwmB family TATA-box binding protein [Konateibacter massiliensis]
MKKTMVFLIAAIWIFLGISHLKEQDIVDDSKIVEAFSQPAFSNEESTISVNGEYTGDYLGTEGAKALLAQIAQGLGIDDNFELTQSREEARGEVTLTKEAKRARTTLKFITVEGEAQGSVLNVTQYVFAEIKLLDTADCALAYRNMLEDIVKNNQITGEVTLSLKGKYPKGLNVKERNVIADTLLENMDTNIVTEQRTDDLYTIYGYSKYISEYKKVGGEKINVSLAMNYNEEEDATYVYLSTPLISEDY